MMLASDFHYLSEVTQLGETHEIIATEDIRNEYGVKLLVRGARINCAVFDRIVKHKLAKPIDMCFRVADAIDGNRLARRARQLLNEPNALLPARLNRPEDAEKLFSAFRQHGLRLNTLLTNKLTVMEKRRPVLLDHSIRVAATALTLGSLCRLGASDQQKLAVIGLLHDIGQMHLDPAIFDPARKLNLNDWRQIHTHPAIAFLILSQFAKYHPHISVPVFEHHERLDGSGYPRGLKAEKTSKLGRLAAVAELVEGILQKDSTTHLEVVLKTLLPKLDFEVDSALIGALHYASLPGPTPRARGQGRDPFRPWTILREVIESWDALGLDHAAAPTELTLALCTHMKEVKMTLYEAGNLTDRAVIAAIEHDADAMAEAHSLIREALYQIGQMIDQCRPHDGEIAAPSPAGTAESVREWLEKVAALLAQTELSGHR